MNHHIAWIAIQEQHRAQRAHAEKYGIHHAELREQRRRRRVWALPRIRRRARSTVAAPVVCTCAPSPVS